MSKLSAQCDELRAMAESIGLAVPQAATLMIGAADAIAELRDDLQRANAENSCMRDELESVGTAAYLYGRSDLKAENAKLREQGARLFDKTLELGTDNAKLRMLVDGLRYCAHEAHGMCARVPVGGERPFTCCPLYDFDAKEYRCEKLMRELGVEVDE